MLRQLLRLSFSDWRRKRTLPSTKIHRTTNGPPRVFKRGLLSITKTTRKFCTKIMSKMFKMSPFECFEAWWALLNHRKLVFKTNLSKALFTQTEQLFLPFANSNKSLWSLFCVIQTRHIKAIWLSRKIPFKMFDQMLKPIFKLFNTGSYPTLDKDEQDSFQRKYTSLLRSH